MFNKALLVVTKNTDKGNISTIIDDIMGGMKVAPHTYYDYKEHLLITKKVYILDLEDSDEFRVKAIDKVFTAYCGSDHTPDNGVVPTLLFKLETPDGEKSVRYAGDEIVTIPDDDFREVFDMYMRYVNNNGDMNINIAHICNGHDSTVLYVPDHPHFNMFELNTGFKEASNVTYYSLEEIYKVYAEVMDGVLPYRNLVDMFTDNMYIMSGYGSMTQIPIYNTIHMLYSGRHGGALDMSGFKMTDIIEMKVFRHVHDELDSGAFTINIENNHMLMLF